MTLSTGQATPFGHIQKLCKILSRLNKWVGSYGPDTMWTEGQKDGRTDRQIDRVIPIYPTNFVCGVIKINLPNLPILYAYLFFCFRVWHSRSVFDIIIQVISIKRRAWKNIIDASTKSNQNCTTTHWSEFSKKKFEVMFVKYFSNQKHFEVTYIDPFNGLLSHVFGILIGGYQVSQDVDIWRQRQHRLLSTTIWHTEETLKALNRWRQNVT